MLFKTLRVIYVIYEDILKNIQTIEKSAMEVNGDQHTDILIIFYCVQQTKDIQLDVFYNNSKIVKLHI